MRQSATRAALLVLGLGGTATLSACEDYYYPYTYGYGPPPSSAYQGYYSAPSGEYADTSGGYAAPSGEYGGASGGYAAPSGEYGGASGYQGYYSNAPSGDYGAAAGTARGYASAGSLPQVGSMISFVGCPVRSQTGCATVSDAQGVTWDVSRAGGEYRRDYGRYAVRYTGRVSAQTYCTGGPAIDDVTWVQTNQPC
jgi:hypothetical protein